MANRTYAGFWTRDNSGASILDRFERFLGTISLSASRPGFASLSIRAVGPAEVALVEYNLDGGTTASADVIELAREHQDTDLEYEVEAFWDLWERDIEAGLWQRRPERLVFTCTGEAYDGGAAMEAGDFSANVGWEHFYTGHGGLLSAQGVRSAPSDPVEAEFLAVMTQDEYLREYYEKTRENIEQLLHWVQTVEQALPVERYRLWSEGEDNLEARMDEILAAR